jgi:hypothetical protein
VSASWLISIVAGRERVLGDVRVRAQEFGHVQLEGALVCSFQNIPTGRRPIIGGHNFNFDILGNSRLRQNDLHFGVLIAISIENTLFDPVHIVGRGRNSDAGQPL